MNTTTSSTTSSKINRRIIFISIIAGGLLGILCLAFSSKDWFLTAFVRKIKFPGYPNIPVLNQSYPKQLITVIKGKKACFLADEICGQDKLIAAIGDTLTVQINFKNTSATPANETKLGLWVTGTPEGFTFQGGAAFVNGPRITGEAKVIAAYREHINIVPGTCKLYKNHKATTRDEKDFRNGGLYIGTIAPGEVGTLVIQYAITPVIN